MNGKFIFDGMRMANCNTEWFTHLVSMSRSIRIAGVHLKCLSSALNWVLQRVQGDHRSDEMALASTLLHSKESKSVANRLLYSSSWSCRTGKRIESSYRPERDKGHSPPKSPETCPKVRGLEAKKKREKSSTVVEQIYRTRA